MPESHTLGKTCSDIIFTEIATFSPSRLAIVHLQYLKDLFIFFRSFFLNRKNQIVFCRTQRVTPLRNTIGKPCTVARSGIHFVEHALITLLFLFNICNRLWHPAHVLGEKVNQTSSLCITQLITPLGIAATSGCLIGKNHVTTISRQRNASYALTVSKIMNHIGMTLLKCIRNGHWRIEIYLDRIGVFRFCQKLDGKSMVLGSQFQFFAGLFTINIHLIVLRSLNDNLAFQVVAVIHIESKETYTPAICY